jgi:hypothetical protein
MVFRQVFVLILGVVLVAAVACSDDEANNNVSSADGGHDSGEQTDMAVADTGVGDAGADAAEDTGPTPEFFADFAFGSLFLDDSIPQIDFLVTYSGRNLGPDPIVIEECSWVATRRADDSLIAEGTVPFCDDCNPIQPEGTSSDAWAPEELTPGEEPGTVPATFTMTCLPAGVYADTDLSNNTRSADFTY